MRRGRRRHARRRPRGLCGLGRAGPERSGARSSPTRSEAEGHAQQAPIGQTRNDERHNKRHYRAGW